MPMMRGSLHLGSCTSEVESVVLNVELLISMQQLAVVMMRMILTSQDRLDSLSSRHVLLAENQACL